MKRSIVLKGVAGLLVIASSITFAADVHQHGLAQAAVVVEGKTLTVSFRAPLMDILGTEQPPKDAASRARYRERLQQLTPPAPMPAAQCVLEEETRTGVDVLFPAEAQGHDSHDHDHDHHHDDHDHDHQDVEVEWTFLCQSPRALAAVHLPFLTTFSSLTTEVVLLLPEGQGAVRLAPGDTDISLE